MQNINAAYLPPSQFVLPHHQHEKEPKHHEVQEETVIEQEELTNEINEQIIANDMVTSDRDSHQEPPPPKEQLDNEMEDEINMFESPLEQDLSKEWPLVKHEVETMWQEFIILCTQIRAGHLTADTILSLYKFIALFTVCVLTIVISIEVIQSSRQMQ
ncbi:hypothetical protein C9374_002944 [Naegleria lovaniensis]|uniref:Uncharacterized protein n=1 Tax=Naegleria lovaniensis TaxID=51637 RepID=A0AA88KJM5_NAELO|nr:uncharacterized protein C9374_002944 [Naegleria lovaniensis]KAG2385795.1 hypothetical protein C9374_002944 [Naegleria lovaniensis]